MASRRWPWLLLGGAPALLAAGAWTLAAPVPPPTDLVGMSLVGAGVLALLVGAIAAHRRASLELPREERRRGRRWPWWAAGSYAGLGLAALVLGHRDLGAADFATMGVLGLAFHAAAHVLIAPVDLMLGFLVGFLQADALLVVLGCIAFAPVAADLLRRRLDPRAREAAEVGTAAA